MIAGLHYAQPVILTMYLQDKGNLTPKATDLQQYDADIFANRDASLVRIMGERNVPNDPATKSLILLYSNLGPGGSTEEMIDSACQYYLNTVNL
jgi:hypothetical protein